MKIALALWLTLSIQNILPAADHGHLNAGALGTKQNDKLIFDNAADFVSSSGYVKTLTYTNGGAYAGYYQGSITLTALAQTAAHAGPVPNAPALGSFIQAQLVSVEGPVDGAFAFWETGATKPSISLLSGQKGTNTWRLTESDGAAGTDPYGHIHGRRFTVTKPGIYTVGFKLFDTSVNGANGGPIHTPSEVLSIYFQAGVAVQSVVKIGNVVTVTYGSIASQNFTLEFSTNIFSATGWTAIGNPIPGTDYLQSQRDTNAIGLQRYYRVKVTAP